MCFRKHGNYNVYAEENLKINGVRARVCCRLVRSIKKITTYHIIIATVRVHCFIQLYFMIYNYNIILGKN